MVLYSKGPIIDAGPVIDTPSNINSYYRFNNTTANLTFLNLSIVIYFMNMNQLQVHASQIVVLFELITPSPIVASSFCIWKCYF